MYTNQICSFRSSDKKTILFVLNSYRHWWSLFTDKWYKALFITFFGPFITLSSAEGIQIAYGTFAFGVLPRCPLVHEIMYGGAHEFFLHQWKLKWDAIWYFSVSLLLETQQKQTNLIQVILFGIYYIYIYIKWRLMTDPIYTSYYYV